MNSSTKLSKPAKVSAVHSLNEMEYSIRNIAKILGIGKNSVSRYLKEAPESEWVQFGDSIKRMIMIKEEEVLAKTISDIGNRMSEATFYELIGLYKTLSELRYRVGISNQTSDQQPINVQVVDYSKTK